MNAPESELLEMTQRLLDAIAGQDWAAYEELCASDLTCFEPEAVGSLVEGLAFHRFYFVLGGSGPKNTTIVSPHVRMLGPDAGVIGYNRLVQFLDGDGRPQTARFEETRVWERRNVRWIHVHFHRSAAG